MEEGIVVRAGVDIVQEVGDGLRRSGIEEPQVEALASIKVHPDRAVGDVRVAEEPGQVDLGRACVLSHDDVGDEVPEERRAVRKGSDRPAWEARLRRAGQEQGGRNETRIEAPYGNILPTKLPLADRQAENAS